MRKAGSDSIAAIVQLGAEDLAPMMKGMAETIAADGYASAPWSLHHIGLMYYCSWFKVPLTQLPILPVCR